MKLRPLLLCALAYVVMNFPVAVIWHIMLFEDLYRSLGYFEGEPSFALGFAAIASQALILAAVYPRFHDTERPLRAGLLFALAAGLVLILALSFEVKSQIGSSKNFQKLSSDQNFIFLCSNNF